MAVALTSAAAAVAGLAGILARLYPATSLRAEGSTEADSSTAEAAMLAAALPACTVKRQGEMRLKC